MKTCPNCKKTYEDEANFCPEEACATDEGPRRLEAAGGGGVARFERLEPLGGNRTGDVSRARDNQTGAEVALKTLPVSMTGNPVTSGRLEREFKQLMRVNNSHVVRVLDVGKHADGRMFVASEFVAGAESLATALRRGPVSLEQAKAILAQIGEGLLEAQKAGLVHRDLAPKNILIDASGSVKIINFPVPVQADERLLGVPEYASPEQAQGRPVDQRSNTYSLACIFYHLVTGEPPFSGPDARAIFELHNSSLPLTPSQRRPDAALTPDVDRVLLKALDKNSSKRPLTLRLFLNEVEALFPAAPIAAAAPGKSEGAAGSVGFAKTMLFAGGQAEVQQMVQKAIAQRQAATAGSAAGGVGPSPSPAVAPAAANPMYAPTPLPSAPHSAPRPLATASAPFAADGSAAMAARLTPPPVTPNPLDAPMAPFASQRMTEAPRAAGTPQMAESGGKGAAFRETLWFKKGDVEQMVAEAKAKAASMGAPPEKVEVPAEDIRPIEDRYVDDGSVTTDDRRKFSLRTGGTATALPTVGRALPGDKMSDQDMVEELAPGRKIGVLVGIGIAVVVAVVAAWLYLGDRGKKEASAPAASAPVAAPAVAAPPPAPTLIAGPEPVRVPAATAQADGEIGAARKRTAARAPSKKKASGSKAAKKR